MKLNKKEKQFLQMLNTVTGKLLESSNGVSNGTRRRRSADDVEKLKRKIIAARKHMSVKEVADQFGVTPSYVYQLGR
jgi:hypothetical protein